MNSIPVVNLADDESPDARVRNRSANTLRDALCRLGFVRVEGHGLDPALIRRVYGHFERFFSMDDAAKRACSGVAGGQRGFTPFGVEHAKDCAFPDLKEFFHVGQPHPGAGAERASYPANVWPAEALLPGLEEDALALYRALERCAIRILQELAASFELARDVFSEGVVGGNSILRALHYPPLPPVPPVSPRAAAGHAGSLRAAAHEDINLITLLCEATDAGLEIRPPGCADWIPVEVPPGQLVVDSGDMLSRMTNDLIPATTHRVVNPPDGSGHRYSLPFFAHPRPGSDLSVLPHFVSDERPLRHPPITAGQFLGERLREIGLVS